MKLYRAVCEVECQQVLRTRRLAIIAESMEGKWFAETIEDARAWGIWFYGITGVKHDRIVEFEISDSSAIRLFRLARLDNIGPARFAPVEELMLLTFEKVIE